MAAALSIASQDRLCAWAAALGAATILVCVLGELAGPVRLPAEQAAVMAAHRDSEVAALQRAEQSGLSWVVSDSGPLMTAVYSIQYYDDASLLPLAVDWTARSHQVVCCQDDFPWQPDPQRDGSGARAMSQQILAEIFAANPHLPMLAVRGSFGERVETVLRRLL